MKSEDIEAQTQAALDKLYNKPFTDVDLQWLTEWANARNNDFPIASRKILGCIARLEAAERICNRINTEAWVNVTEEIDAWRKAAGK